MNIFEAFMSRVDTSGPCWLWTGSKYRGGYGRFTFAKKTRAAHRFAWEIAHGPIASRELFICHQCDNPACVRLGHLFIGTAADNNADMKAKGRARGADSENVYTAKLTRQQVIQMRRMHIDEVKRIAVKFGVSYENARKIVMGLTWRKAA